MASTTDGDDLTAGQTNKAQSGTELVADQVELGGGNDYIFQVRHEVVSPRVGAIRAQAGLFGVNAAGGDTGVIGSGGRIGVDGRSGSIALKGSGGQLGLRASGTAIGVEASVDPFNNEGFGVLAFGRFGVDGQSPAGTNGVGVYGAGDTGVVGIAYSASGVFGIAPQSFGFAGVYGTGYFGVRASSEIGFGLYAKGRRNQPGGAAFFEGRVAIAGSLIVYGPKSAAVPHADGSHRLLYALESPESWFEDFGEGKLAKGKAVVKIDPEFATVVKTNQYHVFVTPYGDSHGLYVTKKTGKGFEVREQQGGKGNVEFSYRIVAKRKDIKGERLKKIDLPIVPKTVPRPPNITRPEPGAPLRPRTV
jgi:hypothetical protein